MIRYMQITKNTICSCVQKCRDEPREEQRSARSSIYRSRNDETTLA